LLVVGIAVDQLLQNRLRLIKVMSGLARFPFALRAAAIAL